MAIRRSTGSILSPYCICPCNSSRIWFLLCYFLLNDLVLMRERLKQKCLRLDTRNAHGFFARS